MGSELTELESNASGGNISSRDDVDDIVIVVLLDFERNRDSLGSIPVRHRQGQVPVPRLWSRDSTPWFWGRTSVVLLDPSGSTNKSKQVGPAICINLWRSSLYFCVFDLRAERKTDLKIVITSFLVTAIWIFSWDNIYLLCLWCYSWRDTISPPVLSMSAIALRDACLLKISVKSSGNV